MSEPEEVILDGAHHATTAVAALWRRRSGAPERPEVRLVDVRGRLELFTGALFSEALPLGVAEPPAIPNWFARAARRIPRHLVLRHAVGSTDGTQVRLPRAFDARRGRDAAFARYRALATGLTAKAVRGTAEPLAGIGDLLVRDLYLLCESVAVETWLVGELPGLAPDFLDARRHAARERPRPGVLTPLEQRVEAMLADALRTHPRDRPTGVPHAGSPEASLEWARSTARALRHEPAGREPRYRGQAPVSAWGDVTPAPHAPRRGAPVDGIGPSQDDGPMDVTRIRTLVRRPRVRHAPEDEDDDELGMWMVQLDDPQESVEDPMGLQRPADRDEDSDAADLADSLSELPEARLVPAPGRPDEVLASDDPPERTATVAAPEGLPCPTGIAYPEWDWRGERYRPQHVIVREREAAPGDAAWVARALVQHARELERVRRQFERLRPQRLRLRRQTDGPDIDLGAWVTAYADGRAGLPVDDRLYEEVRPARRDASILLLVDVSGSTDSWVADTRRIIDVEKEALLLVCEALDALGDRYAVMAFSGEGPRRVSVSAVKRFEEQNGAVVRRRIAALEPDRFTRSGAALRHASARLAAESSRHRLLLVLSDGKPNDVDVYEGRYGVEDTRQAVAEARLQGLTPFCLTVDRQAPVYLPRIFGPAGYAVIRHAATLPQVLVDVVRLLLRS